MVARNQGARRFDTQDKNKVLNLGLKALTLLKKKS